MRRLLFQTVLLLLFLLPIPLLLAAFRSWQASSQVEWWTLTLFAVAYALTLHLVLVWPQTSLALRPLCWLLVAVCLAAGWRWPTPPRGELTGWTLYLTLFTLLVLWPAIFRAIQARHKPPETVALGPVLRGGVFIVERGGSGVILNGHMRYPPLRYAVDFIGIGPRGRHASGFLPADPQRYAIFGADVLAPCDGVVLEAVEHHPDVPVPETDSRHPAGNHIVLDAESSLGSGVRITLAHLKRGSLRVHVGQGVQAGQVIAQVGNSGNTTAPHLHLGVVRGEPWTGEGLPCTIAGRFAVKGMVFKGE